MPNDDDLKVDCPRDAFERLVEAAICERVIPFIGAGVSFEAKYSYIGEENISPSKDLPERLVHYLISRARNNQATRSLLQGALDGKKPSKTNLNRLGLPWLAELFLNLNGGDNKKLCKHLKIERFTDLQPTLAHRYIAFLARENLIHEVITTNYDCCLERAFKDSLFDRHEQACLLHIVRDLDSFECRFSNGRPLLTVYKINGCAERYKEDPDGKAHQIILAEKELQNWHGESWARTLFQDRLGRSSVVLTGFGIEEAQVRFDMKALYQNMGTIKGDIDPEQLCARPNSPFIQAFFPYLNRFQRQVLNAWFEFRSDERKRKKLSNEKREAAILANAFTGSHREFFRETKDGLTADRFWEAVFTGVWRCLIEREFAKGPTAEFFGFAVPFEPVDMIAALFCEEESLCPICGLITIRQDLGSNIPLAICIEKSRLDIGISEKCHRPGKYYSIFEQGLLVGLFVLMLAWSNGSSVHLKQYSESDVDLGLLLRRESGRTLETWLAWSPRGVATPNPVRRGIEQAQSEEPMPIIFIQIVVNTYGRSYSRAAEKARKIHRWVFENGEQYRQYGIRVDLGKLLVLAEKKQQSMGCSHAWPRWKQFCAALDDVVDRSFAWSNEIDNRPSFRDWMDPEGIA